MFICVYEGLCGIGETPTDAYNNYRETHDEFDISLLDFYKISDQQLNVELVVVISTRETIEVKGNK